MALLQAADDHHRLQARLAAIASRNAVAEWDLVPLEALDTWRPQRLARQVTALQLLGSRNADPYVTAALTEQGINPAASGRVNASAFIGTAGDGRSLVTLLDEPRIQAKTAIGQGTEAVAAWESARASLQRMAVTAVQDATRVATGVATTARRHADGQVRQLNPPSCSRCAILAGRWYRWDAGFDRHISCDCIGIPVSEDVAGDMTTDPEAAVRAGQVTGLSRAEMKAFNEGADLNQLVNIHRGGIHTAGVYGRTIKYTTEGTTRRGIAGQLLERSGSPVQKIAGQRYRRVAVPRLTPEQIYRDAADRESALALLRRFGYIL